MYLLQLSRHMQYVDKIDFQNLASRIFSISLFFLPNLDSCGLASLSKHMSFYVSYDVSCKCPKKEISQKGRLLY